MGISSPIGLAEGDGLAKPSKEQPPNGVEGVAGLMQAPAVSARCAAVRRGALALRALETLLLITGATLLVVYAAAQVDARLGHEQALEAFAQARAEHVETAAAAPPTPVGSLEPSIEPDQSLWGQGRIAAYRDSLRLHHDAPLGVLTIPSIRFEAPIFDGTSELTLNRGIGRIEGTADVGAAGNLGLAGHRDGFFRPLKDVHVGDAIAVESLRGTTLYRITELMVVEPTDVQVLAPTDTATLTLVTCYPFYFLGEAPQRYIVKAVVSGATATAAP